MAGERPRAQVQRDIKQKERAREALAKKYRNGQLSEEAILWCIYSISDNNSYLLFNRCAPAHYHNRTPRTPLTERFRTPVGGRAVPSFITLHTLERPFNQQP